MLKNRTIKRQGLDLELLVPRVLFDVCAVSKGGLSPSSRFSLSLVSPQSVGYSR